MKKILLSVMFFILGLSSFAFLAHTIAETTHAAAPKCACNKDCDGPGALDICSIQNCNAPNKNGFCMQCTNPGQRAQCPANSICRHEGDTNVCRPVTTNPGPNPNPNPNPAPGPVVILPTNGTWVIDPEVTFTGKNAARAKELLNWTLQDYRWTFTKGNGQPNPLETFWVIIRNIIYAVFILFVIATAFILIATRGKSLSAMRFIPRFFAIVLLVTFSFSLISLLYQTTDLVQGFFLRSPRPPSPNAQCPPSCVSQEDLFFIDWDYEKFVGYRLVGDIYAESAFINLLLVKLTAFTYFTMVGMLFVRKIVLWFFIILSPVFPLLLLYYPVRNTGKIWIGEFFRWLLYAPLFAIFLKGLVVLWRQGIPLNFDFSNVANDSAITYPTATSILIGGPSQALAINNSANVVNTFAQYIVALLMLWMVILLPWVLLQIFLEYAMSYNYADNPAYKGLMGWANHMRNPQPKVPPPIPPPRKTIIDIPPVKKPILPPPPPAGTGLARTIPTESTAVYKQPSLVIKPMPSHVKTLRMTNLSVPTLRDVARFETAMVSNKADQIHEISRVKETLTALSNPTSISSVTDQSRMTQIREQLVKESQTGNIMATTILNATKTINNVNNSLSQVTNNSSSQVVNQIKEMMSNISHPETISNAVEKQKYVSVNQSLTNASKQGNQFATATLNQINTIAQAQTPEAQKAEIVKLKETLTEEKQKGNELAKQLVTFVDHQATTAALPTQNQVQTVSLEDYEAVRKMWEKNYQTMEVPQSIDKGQVSRAQWIQDDINDISKTINLLSSSDPELVDEGLQEVSTILPFLMMGGFTLPEITSYLKAKQQAATDSLEQVKGKQEEEESLVDATGHQAAAAVKHQTVAIPTEDVAASGASAVSSGGVDDDDDESALSNLKTQVSKTTNSVVNIFPSIMNAVKLAPNSTPNLRDVVKYESSMVSGSQNITSEVTKTQDLLTQLADPTIIMNTEERERVQTLRAQLEKESQAGNPMATSIIQAATTIASVKNMTQQVTSQVRSSLTSITNPETVTDTTNQQTFKEINQELLAGKANGDQFATNVLTHADVILKTTPNTYNEQVAVAALKVKVDAEKQKGNQLAEKLAPLFEVNVEANSAVVVKSVLQGILHPESISDVTKQSAYREINTLLQKEKENNNELATMIFSTGESIVSKPQDSKEAQESISQLTKKVEEEKQKGNVVAQKVSPLLTAAASTVVLPKENKVQSVSLEDYEAVKKMWQENYQNMDVPQNITEGEKSRKDWIEDDIVEITRIINLLSSPDPKQQNEGITAVSHILPFLLIGGFSMSEIIAYLKAKLEAAKVALGITQGKENEEDQKVDANSNMSPGTNDKAMVVEETPPITASSDDVAVTPPASTEIPVEEALKEKPPLKELGSDEEKELRYPEDTPNEPKELEELDGKN